MDRQSFYISSQSVYTLALGATTTSAAAKHTVIQFAVVMIPGLCGYWICCVVFTSNFTESEKSHLSVVSIFLFLIEKNKVINIL